jgi:hypothetical protein
MLRPVLSDGYPGRSAAGGPEPESLRRWEVRGTMRFTSLSA